MSTTQITHAAAADIICGLKAAVTALECYHHMELLKQQEQPKPKRAPPPMFMMIPIEEDIPVSKKKSATKCKTREPMKDTQHLKERVPRSRPRRWDHCMNIPGLKYPEMRSGVLYTRCYCVHRDGLQDSCPLTQCQGQPECLVKPWPVCLPAKYMRCRFPEQYQGNSESGDMSHHSPLAHAG